VSTFVVRCLAFPQQRLETRVRSGGFKSVCRDKKNKLAYANCAAYIAKIHSYDFIREQRAQQHTAYRGSQQRRIPKD
jgi:hypothetical protein